MQIVGDVFLRFIADGLVIPIVVIGGVAMLRLPRQHRVELISRAIVAGLLALVFAKIISLLYQGERPFELLGLQPGALYLNNPGFPSDHALLVFLVTFVVWASTRNKRLGVWLLVLSVLVAVGRVAALVHTPADVFGGFVCALAAASIVYGRQLLLHRQH